MYTAYANNIRMRFGNHLRRAVNTLLNIRTRMAQLRRELRQNGSDQETISRRIFEEITRPARQLKEAITQGFMIMKNS
jgi:hypothetical protein